MQMINRYTKILAVFMLVTSIAACSAISGRETVGEYVDDATISTKVRAQIFNNPNLKKFQVRVETFQGVVQLSGFVDSNASRNTAEDIARNVSGVKSVKNDIVVR